MYGYEYTYEPATEGFFSNIFDKVKRLIEGFGRWIRTKIANIGSAIKSKKRAKSSVKSEDDELDEEYEDLNAPYTKIRYDKIEFSRVEVNTVKFGVDAIIGDICKDTTEIITSCAECIKQMIAKFNDNTSNATFKEIADEFTDTLQSYDKHCSRVKENFSKLHGTISDEKSLMRGYKELSVIYHANGRFGQTWSNVKSIHEYMDDNSKIKPMLGKIISMYNFAIKNIRMLGNKLMVGPVHEIRSAEVDKKDVEELRDADKKRGANETAGTGILSKLYDMAYEDAMDDIINSEKYISIYNSVPSAFD